MTTVNEYACGIHDLKYFRVRPGCPACELQRKLEKAQTDAAELEGQLAEMHASTMKMKGAVNLTHSMQQAADLLDGRDRAFLKTVLYSWRDHKDVDLSVTEDHRNFLTNETLHACSSIGGAGIAGFYQEAVQAYGRPAAIGMLQRAMGHHLRGGADGARHAVGEGG